VLGLRTSPNPGADQTAILLELPVRDRVCVSIYDAAGRRVRDLYEGVLGAGAQSLFWDSRDDRGRQVPAGIYLVRASAGGATATSRQMILR
jgi:flagellar hook assembly protein FlgD